MKRLTVVVSVGIELFSSFSVYEKTNSRSMFTFSLIEVPGI